jgi:uncharacterized membrane protein YesL
VEEMDFERYANSKLYAIFDFIYKLMFINILWFLLSLFGLFILTLAPATIAMYLLINSMINRQEFPIFRSFIKIFKREFFKSQKILGIILLLGLIIYFDISFFYQGILEIGNLFHWFGFWFSVVLILFYSFTLVHLLPIYIYFPHLNASKIVKYAFLMSMSLPIQTITVILINVIIFGIIYFIPSFISFIPILAFAVIAYLSLNVFKAKYVVLAKDSQPLDVTD